MKDAECAETNEKSVFATFSFRDMVDFVLKIGQFSMNFKYKIDHNSKTKNWKIDFSFVSAHFASSIKTGSELRWGGLNIPSWEIPM